MYHDVVKDVPQSSANVKRYHLGGVCDLHCEDRDIG
jgi:hypothetical protein